MPRLPIPALFMAALLAACGGQHKKDPNAITSDDLSIPASGYDKGDPADLPQMTFDSATVRIGRIAQGVQVDKVFRFVNTGRRDLVITDVRSDCGCTVGKDWPKGPVHPGDEGRITVHFNSENISGAVTKRVTVAANTQPMATLLTIEGEVIAPPVP
ncbi:MAG: DUF1573 domain-containing protein [Flavobacteriales bacterium]